MTDSSAKVVARAAVAPAPLVVAAATALGVYFLSPWLLPPGLLIYVLLVHYLGPVRHRRQRAHFEQGLDLKDGPPGLKRWNALLNETLSALEADLAHAQGPNSRLLQPVGQEVHALAGDIRRLIRQAYLLHRYLNQTNTAMISARAAHLEAQVAATADEYSRRQLQEAGEALRRQLANCEQIRVLIGRTEATLENMQASLQAIGSSVVKLGAGDPARAGDAQQDSLQRLANARSTVASLEEVLHEVQLA